MKLLFATISMFIAVVGGSILLSLDDPEQLEAVLNFVGIGVVVIAVGLIFTVIASALGERE